MTEAIIPMMAVQVVAYCDCGGIMEVDPTANVLLSNPPKYPHKCRLCGKIETSEKAYPFMRYVPLKKGEDDG